MVQRRQDGSVDFNRNWVEYEDDLNSEFWYGLRALHCLTSQGGWEMRIDLKLSDGTKVFLQYEQLKSHQLKTSTNYLLEDSRGPLLIQW